MLSLILKFFIISVFFVFANSQTGILSHDNFIEVQGNGEISFSPDIAFIYIETFSYAQTATQALQRDLQKVNFLNQNLQYFGSNEFFTQSISTNVLPCAFNETKNLAVNHNLKIKVNNLQLLGKIIDKLSSVDGIKFYGVKFDRQDKLPFQVQARRLALEDARKKASDYATLAQRLLGKVIMIVDQPSAVLPSGSIWENNQVSNTASDLQIHSAVLVKFLLND